MTLYLANQGLKFTIKSHFWWDFLFSPFHLKSIPLKSSANDLFSLKRGSNRFDTFTKRCHTAYLIISCVTTRTIPLYVYVFSNKSSSNQQLGIFEFFSGRWWLGTRTSHICSNRIANYGKQTAHPSWRNFPMTSHSRMKVLPSSTNTVAST